MYQDVCEEPNDEKGERKPENRHHRGRVREVGRNVETLAGSDDRPNLNKIKFIFDFVEWCLTSTFLSLNRIGIQLCQRVYFSDTFGRVVH